MSAVAVCRQCPTGPCQRTPTTAQTARRLPGVDSAAWMLCPVDPPALTLPVREWLDQALRTLFGRRPR